MPKDLAFLSTGGALAVLRAGLPLDEKESSRPIFETGKQFGPFKLASELGQGGSSAVYLAQRADGDFAQTVALKIVRSETQLREAFRRERRILATLEHPNIARLIDGGETEDNFLWVALEYVDGLRIDAYCQQKQLRWQTTVDLLKSLCIAIHYAHQNRIVHGDIKPTNVLIDGNGTLRLLDFGIARPAESNDSATRPNTLAFTPGYASPEQRNHGELTTASDIYQIGLLLKALLLDNEENSAQSRQSMSTLRRRELKAIAERACQENPHHRYPSVMSLHADLSAMHRRLPVSVISRPSYRLNRLLSRNRWTAGVAALALICLLTFGIIAINKIRDERDVARIEMQRSDTMMRFMKSLFSVSDPGENRGNTFSANDILTQGASKLRSELEKQPTLRTSMGEQIAGIFLQLGEISRSRILLESTLTDAIRDLPEGAPERIKTRTSLAYNYYISGKNESAEQQLKLARAELFAMDNDKERLIAELAISNYEAALLMIRGKAEKAIAIQRHVLNIVTELDGPNSDRVASAWRNLATAANTAENYTLSLNAHQQALAIFSKNHGEKHPLTMAVKSNLAASLNDRENFLEARKLLLPAVNQLRELSVGQTVLLAEMIGRLADAEGGLGNHKEALKLAVESYEMINRITPDSRSAIYRLNRIALSKLALGDSTGAIQAGNDALTLCKRTPSSNDLYLVHALMNFGEIYLKLNQASKAKPLLLEALVLAQQLLSPTSATNVRIRLDVIESLVALQQFAEAEHHLSIAEQEIKQIIDITAPQSRRFHELKRKIVGEPSSVSP